MQLFQILGKSQAVGSLPLGRLVLGLDRPLIWEYIRVQGLNAIALVENARPHYEFELE